MDFENQPFKKTGETYEIPCIDGIKTVDLIVNEDAAIYTDNINIQDGAFTVVDHDTENEKTVYPFNVYGKWIWAENADKINDFVKLQLVKKVKYFNGKELKPFTKIGPDGKTIFIENEFFATAEKFAIDQLIFNVANYNEFVDINKGNGKLDKIPGPIIAAAFGIWLKYHDYDKNADGFVDLMCNW